MKTAKQIVRLLEEKKATLLYDMEQCRIAGLQAKDQNSPHWKSFWELNGKVRFLQTILEEIRGSQKAQ